MSYDESEKRRIEEENEKFEQDQAARQAKWIGGGLLTVTVVGAAGYFDQLKWIGITINWISGWLK